MRPKIKDFYPADAELYHIHDDFKKCHNLYVYINALDNYIDELEEKILCSEKTEA